MLLQGHSFSEGRVVGSLCGVTALTLSGLFFSFASQPSPRAEKAALPCSRFLTHMKNFSASHKTDKLHFLPFPGKLAPRNPMVSKDTVVYIGENRMFIPFSTSRQGNERGTSLVYEV